MTGCDEDQYLRWTGVALAVPAVVELLDQLAESVLVARPVRDPAGRLTDFTIEHVSPSYVDPVGRSALDLAGLTLLQAYPGCADGLLRVAAKVLADEGAIYLPGAVGDLLAGGDRAVEVADLRAAPFEDGVVFTWRRSGEDAGLNGQDLGLRAPAGPEAGDHELATRLQFSLLPPDPRVARAAGVDIAVRYRPAGGGRQVAGDWYDVLPVPGGDLLLVVGDIAGHGVSAVTGMSSARNALRGLAGTGAGPRELLRQLNYGAVHLTEGTTGTVICGRYHPATRMLRWARAGHLPPVLVRDGVASALDLPDGLLLGAQPDADYEEVSLQLRSGDTLLLYTDGLVERRAASISDSLADFVAAAVPGGPDADSHAARIFARAASDTGDDACLLACRIR